MISLRRRVCGWRHHNIRWGRKWVEYDPALNDPEATVLMQLCFCRRTFHLLEIRWGDGTVT